MARRRPEYYQISRKRWEEVFDPSRWSSNAYYCFHNGQVATEAEAAHSSYTPCIKVHATDFSDGVSVFFVVDLINNKVYWGDNRHQRGPFSVREIKPLIRQLFRYCKFLIWDSEIAMGPWPKPSSPGLVSTNIISIQPLPQPKSLIFYIDFVYGRKSGSVASGAVCQPGNVGHFPTGKYCPDLEALVASLGADGDGIRSADNSGASGGNGTSDWNHRSETCCGDRKRN